MLYDVSDLLFWWFKVTGSGLTFGFCVQKTEKWEKKSANEQGCVLLKLPVYFCDSLVASFLPSLWVMMSSELWCLWRPRTFSVTFELWSLHYIADNHTSWCIYSRAEEQHRLMSVIDSRVRQTGTCWADIGVQSSDRKLDRWDKYS